MRVILRTHNEQPREPLATLVQPTLAQVQALLPPDATGLLALDTETTGLEAHNPKQDLFAIGFADARGCWALDLRGADTCVLDYVRQQLGRRPLTAFNVVFDGAWLQRWTGTWLDWRYCSLSAFKQLSNEGWAGQRWNLEVAQREVLGWASSNKDAIHDLLSAAGLSKAQMDQLPPEHVLRYCASDADAAWQLVDVLTAAAAPWPEFADYHERVFMTECKLLVENQFAGIPIDQRRLAKCHVTLLADIALAKTAFLSNPDVARHIARLMDEAHGLWMARRPADTTKAGKPAVAYARWLASEPTTDGVWNINSKPQLASLFFDTLKFKVLKTTPTGRPVIDKQVLPRLGDPGKLLNKYNLLVKRRGYVEAVIAKSARDDMLHPQFKSVGTVTTRLGGSGGLNLQQMPKDVHLLGAFVPPPGHVLVQADAEALEPVLLAAFSRDPTMLRLYGPGAKANDIYLFVGSHMPGLMEAIRQHYDPDAPTPEGVAAAKRHCKRERTIAKVTSLACGYGAGVRKIHQTLVMSGIDVSTSQVAAIHAAYWRLFAGVARWQDQLQSVWRSTGGW
nr:DNA polymerase [bacterium]